MVFPATPLVVTIYLYLGGSWVDVTADVYARDQIAVTWGRQDWASQADTTKCPLTFNNGTSTVNPSIVGRYSRRNAHSDLYGLLGRNTPVRFDLTTPSGAVVDRFEGYISSWPTRWDVSGKDVYAIVQANGIRRRLARGIKPLKDPLRRHIDANSPLAYWPLTDGQSAREGSEVAQGGQPIRSKGVAGSFFQGQPNWGKGSLASWLDAVVELPANTEGNLSARVQQQTTQTTWTCDHFRAGVGGQEDDLTVFDNGIGSNADPVIAWLVVADESVDQVQLRVLSSGETTSSITAVATINGPGIFDLSPHMLRVTTTANGSSTDWELVIDGVSAASGTHAVPHRPISRIRYRWGAFASLTESMSIGHITLWQTPPDAAATYDALLGHTRELAGRRIERLCTEQGVPLAVNGDLDQTPAMGPQKSGAFLDLLESAAEVDGGPLYESRDAVGLAYRTRRSKYNQGM